MSRLWPRGVYWYELPVHWVRAYRRKRWERRFLDDIAWEPYTSVTPGNPHHQEVDDAYLWAKYRLRYAITNKCPPGYLTPPTPDEILSDLVFTITGDPRYNPVNTLQRVEHAESTQG